MSQEHDALGFLDQTGLDPNERALVEQATGNQALSPPPPAVQPAPAKDETLVSDGAGHQIPLATYLDERRRREKAEDALAALTPADNGGGGLADIPVPDPVTDAAGYVRYQAGVNNLAVLNERMNFSEKFARKEYGNEEVDKMLEWVVARFKTDPQYEERVMQDRDPYETTMADYKTSLRAAELPDDATLGEFRAWKAQKAAEGGQTDTPTADDPGDQPRNDQGRFVPVAQQPTKAKPPVPKSIVNTPSGGGSAHTVPNGPGQAFDNVIP